jgi:hypothetical protein
MHTLPPMVFLLKPNLAAKKIPSEQGCFVAATRIPGAGSASNGQSPNAAGDTHKYYSRRLASTLALIGVVYRPPITTSGYSVVKRLVNEPVGKCAGGQPG